MHDLDRIMAEVDTGEGDFAGEYGVQGEEPGETSLDELLQEAGLQGGNGYEVDQPETSEPEYTGFETTNFEADQGEMPLSEVEEMEFAGQLLEITNEDELDQFLGKVFKRVWRRARRVARGVVKPLGSALKAIAKRALPIVGGAVAGVFGGPLGGMVGSQLASGAGSMFGLELEGMSSQDQEYEVARRYVRFASSAAARAARTNQAPNKAVRDALRGAARRFAPGLLRSGVQLTAAPDVRRQRGVWIRRGRAIIVLGA